MTNDLLNAYREQIITIGKMLWDKELASGVNGNISLRVEENKLLITGHKTCLGLLQKKDILLADFNGNLLEQKGQTSTETLLHTEIYKNLPEIKAIIHTHCVYTNAYYLENDSFTPRIFEAKLSLGEVKGVKQNTPSVTDIKPVIEELRKKNLIVLKNHGTVALGENLFDCFLLTQGLEEAIKTEAISKVFATKSEKKESTVKQEAKTTKKYKLFSKEQIDEIVKLVNGDDNLKELGEKTNMTMDLAVKLDESGTVYSFKFEKGKIVSVGSDDKAEFLISAPEKVWRAVFNREIDPFVATTQKKMNLRGDFAKISKWYAPCSRIFELWALLPVE